LIILVILAMTSNQWSMRRLGGKNWKLLHRLAYVAAGLLIYHQAIAGKGHWDIARWLFFSLAALQLARLAKILSQKKRQDLPRRMSQNGLQAVQIPSSGVLDRNVRRRG
jgi:methionine sulfoxide reductase heme-binding subunit